jgi:NAD(P)-dependent dehydrogenase (short-subunit alcohol dehydrogenase family)
MMGRLENKVAIVTGASRGIGQAIATAFASEGARVVIVSRKLDQLQDVAAEINSDYPGTVFARAAHMGDSAQVEELVNWVSENLGVPDILVNNAATNPYFGPFLDVPEAAWDKTFEVNVKGYFASTRAVAKRLLDEGKAGSIINVASIYGLRGAPLQGVYAMTKAAVISMSRTFAAELGGAGIRVNTICPGLVETKFASVIVNTPEFSEVYTSRAPLGRWAQPEEITGIAVYLASDEASYTTGQEFIIDGGYTSVG